MTAPSLPWAFYCGVVLLEMHFYEYALGFFEVSIRELGPSAATSNNMGLCHQGAGRLSQAESCIVDATTLDPTFEPARRARDSGKY